MQARSSPPTVLSRSSGQGSRRKPRSARCRTWSPICARRSRPRLSPPGRPATCSASIPSESTCTGSSDSSLRLLRAVRRSDARRFYARRLRSGAGPRSQSSLSSPSPTSRSPGWRRCAQRLERSSSKPELELGRHSALVGEIETLVTEHPLRERLRGQLMLALYRSGRQVEALEAYRQARETLVDELGIEPVARPSAARAVDLAARPRLDFVEKAAPAVAPPEERRKTVTILFTDIVDSTSLGAQLDPEVLRSIMRRYFDTVRTIVERHDGTVEKFIGDAAMAVFGVPQRHEDDALRAARASSELRDALVGLNAELEREHGLAIQIRTGINTGEVLAGDAASGQPFATGAAVTVAARLQQAALPGETLLGEAHARAPPRRRDDRAGETLDAGGPLGPLQTFRLLALEETSGLRPLTAAPLVGRRGRARAPTERLRIRAGRPSKPRRRHPRRGGCRQDSADIGIRSRSETRPRRWSGAASRTAKARRTCRSPRSCDKLLRDGRRRRSPSCSRATSRQP